jgi:hypothetical protein
MTPGIGFLYPHSKLWFIAVKHTRIIEEHTKGISHHEEHEGHEERKPFEIADRFNRSKSVCSGFVDYLRALRGENNVL